MAVDLGNSSSGRAEADLDHARPTRPERQNQPLQARVRARAVPASRVDGRVRWERDRLDAIGRRSARVADVAVVAQEHGVIDVISGRDTEPNRGATATPDDREPHSALDRLPLTCPVPAGDRDAVRQTAYPAAI